MARFTQEEFKEFLARHPHLTVDGGLKGQKSTVEKAAQDTLSGQKRSVHGDMRSSSSKRKKYGNMRVTVVADGTAVFESVCIANGQPFPKGGLVFDSEKEHSRWRELTTLQAAGFISGLELQKDLVILPPTTTPSGEKIRAVGYKADFYYTRLDGTVVVEDVKGRNKKTGKVIETQVFTLKWKLLKCKYPEYLFRIEA